MDVTVVLVVLLVVGLLVGGVCYLVLPSSQAQRASVNSNLRNLVVAQRKQENMAPTLGKSTNSKLALAAAEDLEVSRTKTTASSKLTLEKRLRYAKWPITPIQYRAIQVMITLVVFIPCRLHATLFIQFALTFLAWCLVDSVLNRWMNKRFKLFDTDYPVLLLSYVSLLKTGMNTIGGLEAAAKGLDPGSLVRSEIELMVERLRLGLTEDQAIGAFGEDIAHPELELFVQSLLLSRRVGGQLSATLERLAKQVRKRQQFREQAISAVGMERSSLNMIAVIMTLLLLYLVWKSPDLVLPAFKDNFGQQVFQFGIAFIFLGFYWSRVVTKIKV